MARKRAADPESSTEFHARRFVGFSDHGTIVRSDQPITNQVTSWCRFVCARIPVEFITPAMLVDSLRLEPAVISGAFQNSTISDWCRYDRFHQWPMTIASTPLEQTVRVFGRQPDDRGDPRPWADEWAWTRLCDAAERKHGHPSRFAGIRPELLTADLVRSLTMPIAAPRGRTQPTTTPDGHGTGF